MEINENQTNNLIEKVIPESDFYIVKDKNGKIIRKSFEGDIQPVSETEYLSSEDLSRIYTEIYEINGKYYMPSSLNINDCSITTYKDVSSIIKRIEELEKLRYTDELTGLPNYQYFKARLGKFAKRNDDKFYIVMLDLDNFKGINDTHGHHFGNKVLINFAEILQTAFRKENLVCKYGGDEFIIAFNGSNQEELINRLELLQANLKKSSIQLSISCGVSKWNKDILQEKDTKFSLNDIKEMQNGNSKKVIFKDNVNNADLALYYSKIFGGKACTTVYSPEIKKKLANVIDTEKVLERR